MAMICSGCGWAAPQLATRPFRCANAGRDDVDHVLVRHVRPPSEDDDRRRVPFSPGRGALDDDDPDPFVRFRRLTHTWQTAMARGIGDAEYIDAVRHLQDRIEAVDGRRFAATPFEFRGDLGVWVKDETSNVAGSHKGRHLMGVMIWLELMSRFDRGLAEAPLAIASCGNAAFAAATLARAARRTLEVFVPTGAVTDRIEALGAHITRCARVEGVPGDPAYLAFRDAVTRGALPLTCQGNENGLVIEGGSTLGWEMASQRPNIERIFIQVGGGALASAVIAGFRDFGPLPRIHAVQTEASPLARAWDLLERGRPARTGRASRSAVQPPGETPGGRGRDGRTPLHDAISHRSRFMWPWETPPASVAEGILDDETYDWVAVVRGMLDSGGWPVVVSEEQLIEANRRAGAGVSATGSAGLAGALALPGEETTAVLFTGVSSLSRA